MAYLDYGVSKGEGFIVITGEIGAGKTTLVHNLFRKLEKQKIYPVQIVNTHLDSDDILRMVAAAFELPHADLSKAALLTSIEQLLRHIDQQGKRVLLVVDEAQNLSPRAVEELRMLSNFQTTSKSLLQTFLVGQPEFRKTLLSPVMQQLRQRVIAAYHLGPMDSGETRTYIEHRLQTVGWRGFPDITASAFAAIHAYSGGIPRKINSLCDRLFLLGYLEEIRHIDGNHVETVVQEIAQELQPLETNASDPCDLGGAIDQVAGNAVEHLTQRLARIEHSVAAMVNDLEKMLNANRPATLPPEKP